jgi:glycosyltransferase involved in cell wall biosynthesis
VTEAARTNTACTDASTASIHAKQIKAGITYWIYNYAPEWEAQSMEVQYLAEKLNTTKPPTIVAFNQRGKLWGRKGHAVFLPAGLALVAPHVLKFRQSSSHVNHVFASAGERYLTPRMNPDRTVLTVGKALPPLTSIERNLPNLRRLRYVVVESERDREILRQGGLHEESLKLIYPGATPRPFVPAQAPFTILFATSPVATPVLLERGINLMIRAAKIVPHVRFLFAWRKYHLDRVQSLISEAGAKNIEVRSGLIPDMGAVYDSVHATILPGLEYGSLKPSPQSALDSLAHGKPLLASRPSSLAAIVLRDRCGVVFEPVVEGLRKAILELDQNYVAYQPNCHATVCRHFSPKVFLERYHRLYQSFA